MSELTDWDIAAANNNDTPPDGWPETTMQYSEVNNTAREGMAVMARYYGDINGSLQTTGPADAYLLTANSGAAAYFQGMYFACEFNAENTGAATINVNSIGVKSITGRDGGALPSGALQAGGIYEIRYDGTNFQLMGTFAGGNVVVDNVQVRTDINTATPPVAEAVTGNYDIYDNDGTDRLARFGYVSANDLTIKNFMRGGAIHITATDAAGVVRNVIQGDPDGGVSLYREGTSVASTVTIANGGLQVNQSITASGFERVMTVSDNALKSNIASPAFTGNPTAPTASVNDNDTSIATTAFVVAQIADDAPTKTGGNASGNWPIDITGHADLVAVADESGDTTCFPLFATAASGNLPAKSGTNLTFNASSGLLSATLLAGGGASITAINATNISSGTLAVARGGTGATATTGTGSNVLSNNPTFTGTPVVTGNFTVTSNASIVTISVGGNIDSTLGRASAGKIEIENHAIAALENTAYESCRINESTSTPSGGSNGDIWLEREA